MKKKEIKKLKKKSSKFIDVLESSIEEAIEAAEGFCSPVNSDLNGTIPALVKRRDGSPDGIRDALGMRI